MTASPLFPVMSDTATRFTARLNSLMTLAFTTVILMIMTSLIDIDWCLRLSRSHASTFLYDASATIFFLSRGSYISKDGDSHRADARKASPKTCSEIITLENAQNVHFWWWDIFKWYINACAHAILSHIDKSVVTYGRTDRITNQWKATTPTSRRRDFDISLFYRLYWYWCFQENTAYWLHIARQSGKEWDGAVVLILVTANGSWSPSYETWCKKIYAFGFQQPCSSLQL